MTWNEGGILNGARHITIAGSVFYITADKGIVVLDMNDPMAPKVLSVIDMPNARATALQFRYLFVADAAGLRVVDVTHPDQPRIVAGAEIPLRDARRVYVARTFAYVADASDGIAIIDVEQPRQPKLYQMFNADGRIKDAHDVVVATTNASLYAYVADGEAGLKVIQLTSPASQPNFYGFSPDPKPELIAWRKTESPALALSKGLDRDRAVDETGNQIAIFGRLGSRPFNLPEMQTLYLNKGRLWTVDNRGKQSDFLPAMSERPTGSSAIFQRPGTQ
jgi:LVIVD repeat